MHRVYSTTLLVLLTCCLGTLWPTRAATITGNLLHITGSAHPDKRITFAPVDTPRNLANGSILWTPRVVTSDDGVFSVVLSAGHYRVSIDGITWAYRCIPDSEATYTFNDSEIQCHSGTGIFLSTNMLYKVLTSTNDLFPQYLYSSLEAGTNIVLIEKDDGTGTNKVVQINSSSSTRISTSQGNTSGDTITITNVSGVAGSTLWTNDLGVLRPLDLGESNPSETFKIYSWGGIGGGLGLGGIWYTPDEGDVFNAVHDASQGESEYAAFHFAAIDHQDATNYATFTTTLHSGTNASGVSTFRAAVDGSISEVTMQAQPYAGVARLEVKNMDETTFSVFDNAGTFVHNMLWAVDGFAMVPSLTTNLVAGVNELETMNKGVMLLTGPTTNPADTIVNLGDGNGVGNLFILINNDQNSAFTLQDGDPLWDNPFAFHRLNGNWISTNRGDAIFLFNNGWFITEIGRISGNTNVSAPVVMNATDTILPYRQSEGVFADSLLQYRDTNYMTLRGTGAGLFIGSHAEAWYGSGLTGESIVAANIVAEGDPDDLEMLITSVDGSDYGQFHVSGSSSSVTTSLAVGGASPSQLFLSTKGLYQKESGSDFNINFDPFGLIAAPAPFYFNQDASLVNPTDPIAIIQYQTNTIFRLNRDSGYAGGGTLFLSDDGTYKSSGATTINPNDNYIPVRTSSTTFGNSPLHVPSSGSTNTIIDGQLWWGASTNNLSWDNVLSSLTLTNQNARFSVIGSTGGGYISAGSSTFNVLSSGTDITFGNSSKSIHFQSDKIIPNSSDIDLGASGTPFEKLWTTEINLRGLSSGADTAGITIDHDNANAIFNSFATGTGVARDFLFQSNGVTVAKIALNSGYTGAGTLFLSDDGTYKSAGGGGTAGTVINTGASTVGAVPRYTDLTGTNIAPSTVNIGSNGGVAITNAAASEAGLTINQFTAATNAAISVNTAGVSQFKLYGEAANTLAMRNGANAQRLNVYGTYTDASNYEVAYIRFSGSTFRMGTTSAGTGTMRGLELETQGTPRWTINTSGHFLANTDNTYDIGASAATRPRDVFVADDVVAGGDVTAGALLQNSGIRVMTPSSLQTLAAANALLANATKVRVVGSGGAVTLTSTPTIADGSDGQYVMIQGTDDTNTLTVQDQGSLASSNLELGAASRTLGAGDVLVLTFDTTASVWYEVSFANN